MGNLPINTTVKSNGTSTAVAKIESVLTTEKATIQDHQSTDQSSAEIVPQVQIVESKSANAVFDRLDEGLKMKDQFNKSKERVSEFEGFSNDYGDEGLLMTIANVGTGKNIQVQNVEMILEFVNGMVKKGKIHLKAIENEIVNFKI